MKSIAFFNNKSGVGKTMLVYHIACMLAEQGEKVLVVDLDPQANLTSIFLPDEELEDIWPDQKPHKSILASIAPVMKGDGDFESAHVQRIHENLHLIAGDLGISQYEDKLSHSWTGCMDGDEAAFRMTTAFYRILLDAARTTNIETLLI